MMTTVTTRRDSIMMALPSQREGKGRMDGRLGRRRRNNQRHSTSLLVSNGLCSARLLPILLMAMTTLSVMSFPSSAINSMATRTTTSFGFHGTMPFQQRTRSSLFMVAKSGGKEILTEDQFVQDVLTAGTEKPLMVFFTAPWCGPCRLSVPVVKEVMKQFANDIDVLEVCTDDLPDVAAEAGIVSIPTIQMYHKGEVMDTIIGCVAKNVLASAVTKVLEDIFGVEELNEKREDASARAVGGGGGGEDDDKEGVVAP